MRNFLLVGNQNADNRAGTARVPRSLPDKNARRTTHKLIETARFSRWDRRICKTVGKMATAASSSSCRAMASLTNTGRYATLRLGLVKTSRRDSLKKRWAFVCRRCCASYADTATESSSDHPLPRGVSASNLSGWVKSFHHLFNQNKVQQLLDVSDVVLKQLPFLRPTEFTMIANHYARCGFRDRRFWKAFCEGIQAGCHDIDGKDLSILLNSLAQVGYKHSKTLEFLASECFLWIPLNDAKNVALTANAFVRLGYIEPSLMSALLSRAKEVIDVCNVIDLGNFANASKKAKLVDVDFLRRLCDRAVELSPCMNEHNIASIVFALGNHQYRCPKLLEKFSLQLSRLADVRTLKIHYIPSIIAAFGSLNYKDGNFEHFVRTQVASRVAEFEAIDLSMILTGLARLQVSSPVSMLSELAQEAVHRIEKGQLDHRGQSNVIMALSKLGFRNKQELWARISRQLYRTLPKLHGEDLSNVAIALSRVSGDPPWREEIFNTISSCAVALGSALTPRALSGIASAFSRLGFRNADLFDTVVTQSVQNMSQFNPRDTVQLLESLSTLGHYDLEVYRAIAQHAARHDFRFTQRQQASLRENFAKAPVDFRDLLAGDGAESRYLNEKCFFGEPDRLFEEAQSSQNAATDMQDELRIPLDDNHILKRSRSKPSASNRKLGGDLKGIDS